MKVDSKGKPTVGKAYSPEQVFYEEKEEGELNSDVEEEVEEGVDRIDKDSPNISLVKEHKSVFASLAWIWKDRFVDSADKSDMTKAHKHYKMHEAAPSLKINPCLKNSWFDPQKQLESSDSIKYWPTGTIFPKSLTPHAKDFKYKPAFRPKDIFIADPDLRNLLNGPKLSDVSLDHTVFQNPKATNVSNSPLSAIDKCQREGLIDNLITEEFLNFALDFIKVIDNEVKAVVPDFNVAGLTFLERMLSLTAMSNQRSYHQQVAGLVTNRLSLRKEVLTKFNVPAKTANMLVGSNFASEGLFGPLPESFISSFSSVSGNSLVVKPKYSNSQSSLPYANNKRSGANYYGNNNKYLKVGTSAMPMEYNFPGARGRGKPPAYPPRRGGRGRGKPQKR